jgi:hypothetical protein
MNGDYDDFRCHGDDEGEGDDDDDDDGENWGSRW